MQTQLVHRRIRTASSIDRAEFWYGYVYVVQAGELFKIGFSKTPRKRFRSFRTGSPVHMDIVLTKRTPYYKHLERTLHNHFHAKRVHGEWFALTESDLEYIESVDNIGRSLRSVAYNAAHEATFNDAIAEGASREEAQRLGRIAGSEANERAVALGYPAEWITHPKCASQRVDEHLNRLEQKLRDKTAA